MSWVLNGVYLVAAILFIFGLKAMSSPKTAAAVTTSARPSCQPFCSRSGRRRSKCR